MKNTEQITGIILAGGRSRRMGRDKGLLELNGVTLTEHIIRALKPVAREILIISGNPAYGEFGYPVFQDLMEDCGPAAGIYTGLSHSTSEKNIVVSCDTPHLTSGFLLYLLGHTEGREITVPVFRSRIHPLVGVYGKSISNRLKTDILQGERKMQDILKGYLVNYLDLDHHLEFDAEKILRNLNTPDELEREEE